jgi:protein-S-isoprenylcysteine O-methyltransferase Ste14
MSKLFAAIGALLFVASLVYFAFSYGWRFADPSPGPRAATAIVIDVLLFSAFALHHSLFARLRLKMWIERRASAALERPIYVWIASIGFILVCRYWQPVPGILWRTSGIVDGLLTGLQLGGIILTLAAARQLDVFVLAGLRSAPRTETPVPDSQTFVKTRFYGLVRHPIYLGWFLMVWCTSTMNGTRLVFAIVSCAYLVVAIELEERDLTHTFGDAYTRYKAAVKWKIVPGVY